MTDAPQPPSIDVPQPSNVGETEAPAPPKPVLVRVLPPDLCNQIAAGEVVERPASAAKELIENALDAGARKIFVDLEKGGRQLIRVTDDGIGMGRQNARLAIERHATSKISTLDDLSAIGTLGFRGEAVPSIASVSRFRMVTKPEDEIIGTEVEVEGGKLIAVRDAAARKGTRIEVRDLFFNTPARLKFLKREATELRRVQEMVQRLALVWHRVHFKLTHNGKKRLDIPSHADPKDRVFAILGRESYEALYPLPELDPVQGVSASGFFSDPSYTLRGTSGQYAYVNGRYVNDRTISAAIGNCYRDLIPKGRAPMVVIHLDVPPDMVDVNVHPAKTEVRFRSTDPIFRAVYRCVREGLARAPWAGGLGGPLLVPGGVGGISIPTQGVPTAVVGAGPIPGAAINAGPIPGAAINAGPIPGAAINAGPIPIGAGPTPVLLGGASSTTPTSATPTIQQSALKFPMSANPNATQRWTEQLLRGEAPDPQRGALIGPPPGASPAAAPVGGGYFSRLRHIGQFAKAYLIATDGTGLVIIHQHAAHERIAFERLKKVWAGRKAETQSLLFPVQLELDALRAAVMEEHIEFFKDMGFDVEPFGHNTFALKAVPALLAGAKYVELVKDALDELSNLGKSQRVEEAIEKVIARLAAHGSVRAGDRLTPEEATALFNQLDKIDFNTHSAYGRPIHYKLPTLELEKKFGR